MVEGAYSFSPPLHGERKTDRQRFYKREEEDIYIQNDVPLYLPAIKSRAIHPIAMNLAILSSVYVSGCFGGLGTIRMRAWEGKTVKLLLASAKVANGMFIEGSRWGAHSVLWLAAFLTGNICIAIIMSSATLSLGYSDPFKLSRLMPPWKRIASLKWFALNSRKNVRLVLIREQGNK